MIRPGKVDMVKVAVTIHKVMDIFIADELPVPDGLAVCHLIIELQRRRHGESLRPESVEDLYQVLVKGERGAQLKREKELH